MALDRYWKVSVGFGAVTGLFARRECDKQPSSLSFSPGMTTADGFTAVGGNPDFGSPRGGVLPTAPVLAAWSRYRGALTSAQVPPVYLAARSSVHVVVFGFGSLSGIGRPRFLSRGAPIALTRPASLNESNKR
jgi:hypothetical protein